MEQKTRLRGILLTLIGGALWGFSGTCGQYLLQVKGLTSSWLVPYRLAIAGVILLTICYVKDRKQVMQVWKEKKDAVEVIVFAMFGMSMCQYCYFTAIGYSNAGTATVLQYIGPVLIMIYISFRKRKLPTKSELAAVILAVLGTFLLATHGNINTLVISKEGLTWGLLSAVALLIYTVQPGRLLEKFGSMVITGWGMLLAGFMLMVLFRPWTIPVTMDVQVIGGMAIVIMIGTVVAFSCYMEGIRCIGPKQGSLFSSIEPVSATIFTVIFMKMSFGVMDFAGFLCILLAVYLLAVGKGAK